MQISTFRFTKLINFDSLTSLLSRSENAQLKSKKKILSSNQSETIIIRIKNNECQLINVYTFYLKINLLFEKCSTKRNLRKSLDDNNLYMHSTESSEVLKASARNNI